VDADSLRAQIFVPTFNRPGQLHRLLSQILTGCVCEVRSEIHVWVIDNDPAGSAREVFDSFSDTSLFRFHYRQVLPTGVSVARNGGLDIARRLGVSVLFIDDDEIPTKHWLCAMLAGAKQYPDSILVGPVLPRAEVEPPSWDPELVLWSREKRFNNGQILTMPVASNNTLLPWKALEEGLLFDARFIRAGGEDTDFCLRWLDRGGLIRWITGAAVLEMLPPERLTSDYLRRRTRAGSFTYCTIFVSRGGSTTILLLKALKNIVLAFIYLFVGAILGNIRLRIRGLIQFEHGRGKRDYLFRRKAQNVFLWDER